MELQEKKAFRKQMLQRRDALTEQYRSEADRKRNERLWQEAWYSEAEVLLLYVSFRSEADTKELLRKALAEGKTVAVPKVDGKNMEFFRVTSMEQLEAGYQGILEPDESCERLAEEFLLQESKKALLFVPGCAFDTAGGRMGYGGGFYDRFMERYPDVLRVALAYDIQVVQSVPTEAHDMPVDFIVTETRTMQRNG